MQIEGIRKLLNLPEYKITKIISWDEKDIQLRVEPYLRKAGICSHCGERHYRLHSTDTVIVEDLSLARQRLFLRFAARVS